jgi:O-glycosyl hydrolase
VVVLNRTEAAIAFALRIGAQTVAAELPARSIATCLRSH